MKNTIISKTKNLINSAKAKAIAIVSMMIATIAPTYCDIEVNGTLNKTTDLIITVLNWGGTIITIIGIVMMGKAVMDSLGSNSQPGAVNKALGVIALGVFMLGAKWVLTYLGISATI